MSSKSTFSNSTSKSYALSLYELAKENFEINKIEEGMNGLKTLLHDSSDFVEMISSPMIAKEEKKKIIFRIADYYNFSQTLKKEWFHVETDINLDFFNRHHHAVTPKKNL